MGNGTDPGAHAGDVARVVAASTTFLAEHSTEPITLHDLAEHVGYSPFHLSRLIAAALGSAPMQYLASLRFHHAKRLLLTTDETVTDICMAVGFSSAGTFSRRFAESVGPSPSEFRRLPHLIAEDRVRPLSRPGELRSGGTLTGEVAISAEAAAAVGPGADYYVGLFARPMARGRPVAGAMIAGPGPFRLFGIPPGSWWLLATALPATGPVEQLVPPARAFGNAGRIAVRAGQLTDRIRVTILPRPPHATPATVALPWLVIRED